MARWDRELIELLPHSMKVMASAGAGYDWVDVDVLAEYGTSHPSRALGEWGGWEIGRRSCARFHSLYKERSTINISGLLLMRIECAGILYCNGAGASTESVADMALYHIISVFRQMTRSSLAARSNIISEYQDAHRRVAYESHNPKDHTLGIVGLGNIGSAIAKKVRNALDMRILYYDVQRKSREQEREAGATFFDDRDELFRQSDCLLLATPAGPPVLTRRALALLPRGARVVNIARGSLVDEDALADALESGHVSAAGLDVHRKEPQVSKRLSEMQNVTLTSHTGGSSLETVKGFERLAMQNVDAVLNGEEPLTAVNKQAVEKHLMRAYANGATANGHVNGNHETNHVNGQTNGH